MSKDVDNPEAVGKLAADISAIWGKKVASNVLSLDEQAQLKTYNQIKLENGVLLKDYLTAFDNTAIKQIANPDQALSAELKKQIAIDFKLTNTQKEGYRRLRAEVQAARKAYLKSIYRAYPNDYVRAHNAYNRAFDNTKPALPFKPTLTDFVHNAFAKKAGNADLATQQQALFQNVLDKKKAYWTYHKNMRDIIIKQCIAAGISIQNNSIEQREPVILANPPPAAVNPPVKTDGVSGNETIPKAIDLAALNDLPLHATVNYNLESDGFVGGVKLANGKFNATYPGQTFTYEKRDLAVGEKSPAEFYALMNPQKSNVETAKLIITLPGQKQMTAILARGPLTVQALQALADGSNFIFKQITGEMVTGTRVANNQIVFQTQSPENKRTNFVPGNLAESTATFQQTIDAAFSKATNDGIEVMKKNADATIEHFYLTKPTNQANNLQPKVTVIKVQPVTDPAKFVAVDHQKAKWLVQTMPAKLITDAKAGRLSKTTNQPIETAVVIAPSKINTAMAVPQSPINKIVG